MPEVLRKFLNELQEKDVDEVWLYLDNGRVSEMIEILANRFPDRTIDPGISIQSMDHPLNKTSSD